MTLEEVFLSHQRVSGLPGRGVDLWGGPENLQRSLENFPGNAGKLLENVWSALKIHSESSSGEVAEGLLGKFGEPLRSPGTFQKLGRA